MPVPDLTLPAPVLAPLLLGCRLRHGPVEAVICETEAYQGIDDLACHAARGRTSRTAVMFLPAGHLYVYRCYGIHFMLNLVCAAAEVPAAVLIRGVRIVRGMEHALTRRGTAARPDDRLANGPGKVCQALDIDGGLNGCRLGRRGCGLRLLPGQEPEPLIACGPRVGVAYAGAVWAAKPWRFWCPDFPVVAGGKSRCGTTTVHGMERPSGRSTGA